jgi:hypothetical protein
MNVAFFLTPKSEVVWIPASANLARARERLGPPRPGALPQRDEEGRYVGTLAEGDLLWYLRQAERPWPEVARTTCISDIPRWLKNDPIHINADIEALLARSTVQSFVPVNDDRSIFVGIVRRKRIIEYCARKAGINVA